MSDPCPPTVTRRLGSGSGHGASASQSGSKINCVQKPAVDAGRSDIVPLGFRRSCTICYRRKVKCDRGDPCSNCVRWKLACHFPDPTRAIRRPRKPAARDAAELLKRLKTLESVVQQWSASPEKMDEDPENELLARTPSLETDPIEQGQSPDQELGKLLIDQGRSRYIPSNFWAHLTDEVSIFNACRMTSEIAAFPDSFHAFTG